MLGQRDPFNYQLAEALGWGSVQSMFDGLSYAEYLQWRAYHVWHNAQQKLAQEKANRDAAH